MKNNLSGQVKGYFQYKSAAFDSLYSENKNFFARFIDNNFRKDIRKRFIFAMREVGDVSGKTVLDVGCGPGKYCVALAKKGALCVTGLDFSENMIKLSQDLARSRAVADVCKFIGQDFEKFECKEKFDLVIAMGIFDYVASPRQFLFKLKDISNEKIIASFPRLTFFRSTQRKIRYLFKGCPVFFYSKSKLENLIRSCGLSKFSLTKLQGDWFVVMEVI